MKQLSPILVAGTAVLAILMVSSTAPLGADDRDLFRNQGEAPYLFVLMDTSGSMTWGLGDRLMPLMTNDGLDDNADDEQRLPGYSNDYETTGVPGSGDDPNSRLYQAKSAIYEAVNDLGPDTKIGFAHFSQGNNTVYRKQWLYSWAPLVPDAEETGLPNSGPEPDPPWYAVFPFPQKGEAMRFGEKKDERYTYGYSCTQYRDRLVRRSGNTYYTYPAPQFNTDAHRIDRLNYLPKLGATGSAQDETYVTYGGIGYRVTFERADSSQVLGNDAFELTVTVASCQSGFILGTQTFTLIPTYPVDTTGMPIEGPSDIVSVDYDTLALTSSGWYNYSQDNPCGSGREGWEDNSGTSDGLIYFPNRADPANRSDPDDGAYPSIPSSPFTRGDVLPWDWLKHPTSDPPATGFELSNRDEFLRRLAPNVFVDGEYELDERGRRIPDFRFARYFENQPSSGQLSLKAPFADTPPFAAFNGTPLVGMLKDLRSWFLDWKNVAANQQVGDPRYGCRQRFAILLTDGKEACDSNPLASLQTAAAQLRTAGVRTFVVGFAPESGASQADIEEMKTNLEKIADHGGTGMLDTETDGTNDCSQLIWENEETGETGDMCPGPVVATNRDELVLALKNIFSATDSRSASFASAAIPTSQVDSLESIFLSDFLPVEEQGVWPGSVKHYVRPLPLIKSSDGNWIPNQNATCPRNPTDENPAVRCFAWDAGEALLGDGPLGFRQSPRADELAGVTAPKLAEFKIGNGNRARRIYWPYATRHKRLDDGGRGKTVPLGKWWLYPYEGKSSLVYKYLFGDARNPQYGGFGFDIPSNPADWDSRRDQVRDIVRETLTIKEAVDPRDSAKTLSYVMGDVFHSDPVVVTSPGRTTYLSANLKENGEPCLDPADGSMNPDATSYRCFFQKHATRRRVLLTGSNDKQFHAFDAGRYDGDTRNGILFGRFGTGSGQEIFSIVPRNMMPRLAAQTANDASHDWGVDLPVRVDDVFVDPIHDGDASPDQRQWRTVAIGGFREGGSGYFAVDITQPDYLDQLDDDYRSVVPDDAGRYVPRCLRNYDSGQCGPLPYPTVLWEFNDHRYVRKSGAANAALCPPWDPIDSSSKRCWVSQPDDWDGDGRADLANSWSKPTMGRIMVTDADGNRSDRFVAIFGGGLDPDYAARYSQDAPGSWLYMVDVETGHAIYKRKVDGAVPSDVAAVDTDSDSVIDTIYFGTLAGYLYKVDVSTPVELEANSLRVGRKWIADLDWEPFKLFDAANRPLFFPPSVVFISQKGRYALAFGTGDREDLWIVEDPAEDGRFFVFLDSGFDQDEVPSNGFTESNLMQAVPADSVLAYPAFLLEDPTLNEIPGYALELQASERMLTRAFTISGVTVFTSFIPDTDADGKLCITSGYTNIYTLFTKSGNGLQPEQKRYRQLDHGDLAGSIFADPGATGEVPSTGSTTNCVGQECTDANVLDTELKNILETLKEQMPEKCKFTNFTVNLRAVRSDTGVEFIAPIPVCHTRGGWYEN